MSIYSARSHKCRINEYIWQGHRLIVMENNILRIGLLASKGADIIEFRYKPSDLDVLWHAPQAICPPGQRIPTTARDQGFFLDYSSGGWQECFPNGGPPTIYKGAELGQHGEVALLPWDVHVREDTAERIEIEFSVETLRTPFKLVRRMALENERPYLRLDESVINLGEEGLAFGWGHHPAFGEPFLEPSCVIDIPPCEAIVPEYATGLNRRLELGRVELQDVKKILAKENRTEDVVLFSKFQEGWVALRNPRKNLAVGIVWDTSVFPYLWCWQVYGGCWGYPSFGRYYTVALEPFNCPIVPLGHIAQEGTAPLLPAGAQIDSCMEVGIFEVSTAISRLGLGGLLELQV